MLTCNTTIGVIGGAVSLVIFLVVDVSSVVDIIRCFLVLITQLLQERFRVQDGGVRVFGTRDDCSIITTRRREWWQRELLTAIVIVVIDGMIDVVCDRVL